MKQLCSISTCLVVLMGCSTMSLAQAATHGKGFKQSLMVQPVTPIFGTTSTGAGALPASVDLRGFAIEPGDQGQVNSCASWSTAHTLGGWYANAGKQAVKRFAPMYLYSQVNNGVDEGSYIETNLDTALLQGIDTEQHYSWGNYNWKNKPTAADRASAANHRTPYKKYTVIYSGSGNGKAPLIEQIKRALAASTPVVIGFNTRQGFDDLGANEVDNDTTSPINGGHAVVALGYNQSGLIIENSWGENWGSRGFGTLSWEVVGKDVITAVVAH
ncbi:peptidase C1 [Xanthomonas hortorum pv. gardneri]